MTLCASIPNLWDSTYFGPLPLTLPAKDCLKNLVKALAEKFFSPRKEACAEPLLPQNLVVLIFEYYSPLSDKSDHIFIHEEERTWKKVSRTSINIQKLFYFIRLERTFFHFFGLPLNPNRMSFRTTLLKLSARDKDSPDPALTVRNQTKKIRHYSKYFFSSEEEGNLLIKTAANISMQGCGKEIRFQDWGPLPLVESETVMGLW